MCWATPPAPPCLPLYKENFTHLRTTYREAPPAACFHTPSWFRLRHMPARAGIRTGVGTPPCYTGRAGTAWACKLRHPRRVRPRSLRPSAVCVPCATRKACASRPVPALCKTMVYESRSMSTLPLDRRLRLPRGLQKLIQGFMRGLGRGLLTRPPPKLLDSAPVQPRLAICFVGHAASSRGVNPSKTRMPGTNADS